MKKKLLTRCGQCFQKNFDHVFLSCSKLLLSFLFLTCFSFFTHAQNATLEGTVLGINDEPLAGATVSVKGGNKSVITNEKGYFKIGGVAAGSVLSVSYAGYVTAETLIGNQASITVKLVSADTKLGEVVVIGYGTQRQKKITGAVGSVSSKDIGAVAVTGFDQAIQGRVAGVQVTQNSGEPGGGVSIRIRGVGSINNSSEPLYIVDGVVYGSINSINPNDIERIDILKDNAMASIYGAQATNGVVLVTTKRGRKGKLTVRLDGYAGLQNTSKKMDLLNGPQFAKLANEHLVNGGQIANPEWSNPNGVQSTDWQDVMFRTGLMQNYNLSLSGGGEKSSTFFSFGYNNQEGILVGSKFERYTVRFNNDFDVTKNLKVGATANASFEKQQFVPSSTTFDGILNVTLPMQPTNPNKTDRNVLFGINPDGSINPSGNTYFGWEGYTSTSTSAPLLYYPNALANPYHSYSSYYNIPRRRQELLGDVYAEYQIIPGLRLKSRVNYTTGDIFNIYSLRTAPNELAVRGVYRTTSTYNEFVGKSAQWNWINSIAYEKKFGRHNMSAVALTDSRKFTFRNLRVDAGGSPDNQMIISATIPSSRTAAGELTSNSIVSYVGRLSYDYAEKYLFTASIRRDGSSKFGPNNRWGTFPALSAGWRISEEKFMESLKIISDLKVRGSWGVSGNNGIGDGLYLSTFTNGGGTYVYTLGNNGNTTGATFQDNVGNPDIKWEQSRQTNVGIDAALFNNMITISADYYVKKIEDMLGDLTLPIYVGINGNRIVQNVYSMENKGFELALGFNKKIEQVSFSANANFSTLDNEVTKLANNVPFLSSSISVTSGTINDGGAQTRTIVGKRIGTFYGYVADGIFQDAAEVTASGIQGVKPGDRRYVDFNKDGKYNDDDKVELGNGLPKYTFGLNLRADYKNFDITLFLNGQAGVQIANMTKVQLYNMRFTNGNGIANVSADMLNSWTGKGSTNELPRNSYDAPTSNSWFSSFNIENGAFVRIRNLQVGYTVPRNLLTKAGISQARLYFAAQNLHTFTKYSGFDPEVGSQNSDQRITGADRGRYPMPRMFTFGFNLQF